MDNNLASLFSQIETLRQKNPADALKVAEVVLRQAEGSSRLQALFAWGGIQRIFGRWNDTESAYYVAAELVRARGIRIGDLLDWLGRMAFLRLDQHRFGEARKYAERAVEICRTMAERRRLSLALTDLAMVCLGERKLSKAISYIREALEGLSPSDRAYRPAVMTLVMALCESPDGDLDEIFHWLGEARGEDPPGSFNESKFRWLEGLAHRRAGDYDLAEACLRSAFGSLSALGVGTDAALCCFDLALVYLDQGCAEKAKRLAGELFPVFRALRFNREEASALMIFRRAAENNALSAEVVHGVKAEVGRIPTTPILHPEVDSLPLGTDQQLPALPAP
ncbi:MAG: tetratricopeptide repeat protein [bacterium]|nr:tetratricopeptide repeat protein [bacterium]